jgi:hypothetical protein
LQEQVSKYALLLQDEKNEKSQLLNQYTNLQSEVFVKFEAYTKQREKVIKKLYLLIGLCISFLAIIIQLLFPTIKSILGK